MLTSVIHPGDALQAAAGLFLVSALRPVDVCMQKPPPSTLCTALAVRSRSLLLLLLRSAKTMPECWWV